MELTEFDRAESKTVQFEGCIALLIITIFGKIFANIRDILLRSTIIISLSFSALL